MLVKEYLSMNFPNMPEGISSTNDLIKEINRSINQDYPGAIRMRAYRIIQDEQLIFHITLPSRKKKAVKYDIVIAIDLSNDESAVLADLPFHIFSNSPSFIFSCARAFQAKNLFCSWLQVKYDPKVIDAPSVSRNPNDAILYERTIFTALYWLCNIKYPNRKASNIYMTTVPSTRVSIARTIDAQENIASQYEKSKDTKVEKERKAGIDERKSARIAAKIPKQITMSTKHTSFTTTSKNTLRTKKTHSTAKTKKF